MTMKVIIIESPYEKALRSVGEFLGTGSVSDAKKYLNELLTAAGVPAVVLAEENRNNRFSRERINDKFYDLFPLAYMPEDAPSWAWQKKVLLKKLPEFLVAFRENIPGIAPETPLRDIARLLRVGFWAGNILSKEDMHWGIDAIHKYFPGKEAAVWERTMRLTLHSVTDEYGVPSRTQFGELLFLFRPLAERYTNQAEMYKQWDQISTKVLNLNKAEVGYNFTTFRENLEAENKRRARNPLLQAIKAAQSLYERCSSTQTRDGREGRSIGKA